MSDDLEFVVEEAAESSTDQPIPDDTMANATLLSTRKKMQTFDDEETERLVWQFRIEDPAYFDRYVWGSTGVKMVNHPNCKLYTWAQSMMGMTLPVGYAFKAADMWRRPCRILIGAREGRNKRDEPTTYNFVEEVLPASAAPGAPDDAEDF